MNDSIFGKYKVMFLSFSSLEIHVKKLKLKMKMEAGF